MAAALKPHVRLVCPVCGVTLPTFVQDTSENAATWVLSPWSVNHLGNQHA